MKPAPISLIEYFATDLSLVTNRKFLPDKPVQYIATESHVDVALARNDRAGEPNHCWQVTLEVRHQTGPETNFPYSYRVVLVGQFGVAPSVKTEDEERTVRIHGASVLYGMTREIVRALTGRGPYRSVILPTVSFYEQKEPVVPASTAESRPGISGRVALRRRSAK